MDLAWRCFVVCWLAPSIASGISPVILIPGDGGNQLEARLDKAAFDSASASSAYSASPSTPPPIDSPPLVSSPCLACIVPLLCASETASQRHHPSRLSYTDTVFDHSYASTPRLGPSGAFLLSSFVFLSIRLSISSFCPFIFQGPSALGLEIHTKNVHRVALFLLQLFSIDSRDEATL